MAWRWTTSGSTTLRRIDAIADFAEAGDSTCGPQSNAIRDESHGAQANSLTRCSGESSLRDHRLARRAVSRLAATAETRESVRARCYTDPMLRELRIENLLLIERAELRLGEGLNAITGETGAGKTVLAHSLDLLMGGKAKAQIVRPGAAEAWVEGVFDLPAGLLDEPEFAELAERLPEGAEEVVLGRRVSAGGRTSAFVAGRAATAADLKLLGGRLLAFFGQHEHRRLTISSAQLEILDGFAGAEHLELRARLPRGAPRVRAPGGRAGRAARARGVAGARPRPLPLRALARSRRWRRSPRSGRRSPPQRERLRHAEGLREAAAIAHAGLAGADEDGGGAAAALAQAEAALQGAAGLDPALDRLAERVAALAVELGDVASELRDYAEGVEADPAALQAVEERLEAIDRLERKHGGSVESVLAHAERCREEIARLEGAEERSAEAEAALAAAEARRASWASELSAGREAAAGRWRSASPRSSSGSRWPGLAGGRAGAAPRRLRRLRARDGRAAGRAQPRDRGGAAARRRLRRRALAGDAGAERAGPGGERGDDGLRRDRRRHRRQDRRGSSASGCRRWGATGRSSASPTCRRSPRCRRPLPARKGRRRRAGRGHRRAARGRGA